MTHSYIWHESFICVTWLIRIRDMTDACMWDVTRRAAFIAYLYVWTATHCNTGCIYLLNASQRIVKHLQHTATHCNTLQHTATHCNTGCMVHLLPIYMCASFICVTWLIHVCDMTHSYVRHNSFIYVTWPVHTWDKTRLRVTWGNYPLFRENTDHITKQYVIVWCCVLRCVA